MTVERFKSLFGTVVEERAIDLLDEGHEIDISTGEPVDSKFIDELLVLSWEGSPIIIPFENRHLMIATHDQIKLFYKLYEEGVFNA